MNHIFLVKFYLHLLLQDILIVCAIQILMYMLLVGEVNHFKIILFKGYGAGKAGVLNTCERFSLKLKKWEKIASMKA